jgi:hypothetical protein
VLFLALDQMHHLRPFTAPGQKKKVVEISQNYLVIFSENREHLTSNACNFLEKHILTPVLNHILRHFTRRVICAYVQDLFAKTGDFIAQNLRSVTL